MTDDWEARLTIKEDALVTMLDDWSFPGELYYVARRVVTDHDQTRQLALGLIAELLVERLAVPGDADAHGFHQWTCSVGEALARITSGWVAYGDEVPAPAGVCWLSITDGGRVIAESALRREGQL